MRWPIQMYRVTYEVKEAQVPAESGKIRMRRGGQ